MQNTHFYWTFKGNFPLASKCHGIYIGTQTASDSKFCLIIGYTNFTMVYDFYHHRLLSLIDRSPLELSFRINNIFYIPFVLRCPFRTDRRQTSSVSDEHKQIWGRWIHVFDQNSFILYKNIFLRESYWLIIL